MAELKTYDWRTRRWRVSGSRRPALVHPDIVLVEINDATIRDLRRLPAAGRGRARCRPCSSTTSSRRSRRSSPSTRRSGSRSARRRTRSRAADRSRARSRTASLADAAQARRATSCMLADAVDPGLVKGEWYRKTGRRPRTDSGQQVEERPVITLPYRLRSTAAAAGFGHNFLAIDRDGPRAAFPPFVRQGDRDTCRSSGWRRRCRAVAFDPEEVVLGRRAIRIRDRPPSPARSRSGSPMLSDPSKTHDQRHDAHQLSCAGAGERRSGRIRRTRSAPAQVARAQLLEVGRSRRSIPRMSSRTRSSSSALTARVCSTCFRRRSARASMPGIQLHASVADSVLSNRFMRTGAAPGRPWRRRSARRSSSV